MHLTIRQAWARCVAGIRRPVAGRQIRFLLVALGLAALFARYVPAWNAVWDYSVYYKASRGMLEGKSPYVQPNTQPSKKPYSGLPYLYSPLFARLLTPLALLDYIWSSLAWVILKCVCLEACVLLVIGLLEIPFSVGSLAILHLLVMAYQPITLDVGSGNVATLEITAILGGLLAWRRNRPTLGGFLLALPVMVKPTCLLILLYALHRRAWSVLRGAGLAVLAVGLGCIADWRYLVDLGRFLRSPMWALFWDELVQGYYNFSAVTVIQRVFGETYFTERPVLSLPWLPPILVPLAPVSILIFTAWAVARSERQHAESRLHHSTLSLVLITALLLPARLAGYSLAWTLFPLASLAHRALVCRDWFAGLLTVFGLILIQIHVEPQHTKPGLNQLLIDHYFWGLLFLYAASLREVGWIRRDVRTENREPQPEG